jgi:hypothetical protein
LQNENRASHRKYKGVNTQVRTGKIHILVWLYADIVGDLGRKKIFSIDLSLDTESSFNERRLKRKFERTIYQKGRILYEQ